MAARLVLVDGAPVDLLAGFTWQYAWDTEDLSVLQAWFVAHTGPKQPLTLTTSVIYTVDSQAAANLLVGRTVTGRVLVTASDVWLRHFKVIGDGSGNACLEFSGALSGVVAEDFEVDGAGLAAPLAAVGGSSFANVEISRAYLHDSLDRIRLFEGSTYRHIYATAPVLTPDVGSTVHADAAQVVRAGEPVAITESWLDSPAGVNVTSAVIVKTDAAAIDDVTVDSCYLNGGRYTVIVEEGAFGVPTNIAVTDNRFGRDYESGLWSGEGVEPGDVVRTGNVWADTLTPVPLTWGLLE
jgi:hypothetical protein